MSRGLIGESPCYTPFSTQMSSAVSSIGSFVKEQHRQNDFAASASATFSPIYHMSKTSSYTHPKVDLSSPWASDIDKLRNTDLGRTIEQAKNPHFLNSDQKERLRNDPSFRLTVESGMNDHQKSELSRYINFK